MSNLSKIISIGDIDILKNEFYKISQINNLENDLTIREIQDEAYLAYKHLGYFAEVRVFTILQFYKKIRFELLKIIENTKRLEITVILDNIADILHQQEYFYELKLNLYKLDCYKLHKDNLRNLWLVLLIIPTDLDSTLKLTSIICNFKHKVENARNIQRVKIILENLYKEIYELSSVLKGKERDIIFKYYQDVKPQLDYTYYTIKNLSRRTPNE